MEKPLCFVLMPFGIKKDPGGGPDIDFNAIYDLAIRPAIEAAEMEPIRDSEERAGGIIHKGIFERLLLCDFAVADLTTANANVFYELGVRHAVRPATTLAIFAAHQKLPFDVYYLRALAYQLSDGNRFGSDAANQLRIALAERLRDLREHARAEATADSPVFQLLTDFRPPDIARLRTDAFRDRVRYSAEKKRALAEARRQANAEMLQRIDQELGRLDAVEAGIVVDLFLSYRALLQWHQMVDLYLRMPVTLQRSVLVREQYGFALNRLGRRQEALAVLQGVVDDQGPSSETCGLIGRVYKDLWTGAATGGHDLLARAYLDKAIDAYVRGFEADWRDAYPGINALTLLDIKGDPDALFRKDELLPVVRFAVRQRLRSIKPDYWDHATLLELAVLARDWPAATRALGDALASIRERWEPATTANNLELIRTARRARGVSDPELDGILTALRASDVSLTC